MIGIIVKKEFYSHLLTFRLWAAVVLCFVLLPIILHISIRRYEEKLRNYHVDVERYDKELREARVYSFVRPTIVRPPQVLSILCSGIEDNIGRIVPINLGSVPFIPTGEVYGQDNPFLAAFAPIDMAFILLIVISLFSILITYDAISGEKEQGLLRQMLSNPVFRHQIIISKYIGALLVILPLIIACFLLAILMMLFSSSVQLSLDHFAQIGLLFLVSCFYSSVFILLGLFISSRTSQSSVSLMLSLFIWILLVLIIPNVSFHIVNNIYPVPSLKKINDNIASLEEERGKRFNELRSQIPAEKFAVNLYYRYQEDGGIFVAGNSKDHYDRILEEEIFDTKLRLEYANKKWDIQRTYVDVLIKQRQLAARLAILSPAFLFQETTEAIAGVSCWNYQHFMQQARLYRLQIIHYLRQKRELQPYRYITPDDESKMMTLDDWLAYWTSGRYNSYDELFKGRSFAEAVKLFEEAFDKTKGKSFAPEQYPPLDLSDLPAFQFQTVSITESFRIVLYRVFVILLMNIIFFYLSHHSFRNYDAR